MISVQVLRTTFIVVFVLATWVKYCLGIEVERNEKGLCFCQQKYALEIVEESGLLGHKPVEFPMETNHKLALANGPFLSDSAQ